MTDPLAAIQRRQRQDVNLLYSTLGLVIDGAFAGESGGAQSMTEADRLRVMGEVDRAIDIIYGYSDGGESAIRDIVLRDTQLARLTPLDVAIKRWRREMGPELRSMVEAEAQG